MGFEKFLETVGILKAKKAEEVELIEEDFNIEDGIDRDSLHAIFPFSWEEYPDYIQSGENFTKTILIIDYPKKAYGNWLSELKRKKGNINIVQFLKSASSAEMIQYYKKTIENKEAELLKTYDPVKTKQLKKYIASANLQLDKYLDNTTTFVYQYTYIYLRADSKKALDELTDSVQNTLVKLQLKPMIPVKASYQAFWSTMPILENLLGDYTSKESNTEVASSMFPFDDGEILDLNPYSDIEGINIDTESIIAIDKLNRNKTLNQNETIIGGSGVGKTTYMIQKILRYACLGHQIYIIDPENEYTEIVQNLGGAVLHLSSNSPTKINPCQIFTDELLDMDNQVQISDEEKMATLIKDKIQRLKGFLEAIKPDISKVETSIMDGVMTQVYRNKGIFDYKNYKMIPTENYPILEDIYNQMTQLKSEEPEKFAKVQDLYFILESYTTGSNTLFNGYTNVNLDSQVVSFDLKPLQSDSEVQGACYLNTFQFLWDEITKDRTKIKKLFVDEFHFLTLHTQSATFFHQAYKRFRKYKAGAIAGTQQIQDVLQGTTANGINVGQAIIGNSFTKVFFGLGEDGVDDVINRLKVSFSAKEKKLLSRKRQGEALIIYGSQRAFMKVELTEEELRLIDPEKYMKKYDRQTPEQPDYSRRILLTDKDILEIKNYQL
ncbi:conjugal transfer protein [Streptococcus iniae]|nr:conjugal transfer protein [Streptococcus iniae]